MINLIFYIAVGWSLHPDYNLFYKADPEYPQYGRVPCANPSIEVSSVLQYSGGPKSMKWYTLEIRPDMSEKQNKKFCVVS